jgi:preprotein translocase subunit SecA
VVDTTYASKAATLGAERMRWIEKQVLLQIVDMRWREHLGQLDHLRSVIHLRGYGQRDPLNEFKSEAFQLFEKLLFDLRTQVTRSLMHLQNDGQQDDVQAATPPTRVQEIHADPNTGENEMDEPSGPHPVGFDPKRPETWGKVSRNDACPCGSGKKYKHCHGSVANANA